MSDANANTQIAQPDSPTISNSNSCVGSGVEKAQLDAEKKIEAIGLIASGIAHDFNNILTIIDGYAKSILMRTSEDDPLYHPLQEICSASAHGYYLTKQMLAFSKRQVLKPDLLDLNRLVHDNIALMQRVVGDKVDLVVVEGGGLQPVWAESGQVAQVLLNLVVHARDMVCSGGSIHIRTSEVEINQSKDPTDHSTKFALLSVSVSATQILDSWSGEHLENNPPQDVGVGITTAKNVLSRLGGQFAVLDDSAMGRVFQAYFPQLQQLDANTYQERLPIANSAVPVQSRSATILVTDDDRGVRNLTCDILKEKGYQVLLACSGEEALEVAQDRRQSFDLLISDLVLPGISGTELAERVRALRPNIRVLIMSGYISQSQSVVGVSGKHLRQIGKPFTPAELVSKVDELLRG